MGHWLVRRRVLAVGRWGGEARGQARRVSKAMLRPRTWFAGRGEFVKDLDQEREQPELRL